MRLQTFSVPRDPLVTLYTNFGTSMLFVLTVDFYTVWVHPCSCIYFYHQRVNQVFALHQGYRGDDPAVFTLFFLDAERPTLHTHSAKGTTTMRLTL